MRRSVFAVLALLCCVPAIAAADPAPVPLSGLTCVLHAAEITPGPDLALYAPGSGLAPQPDTLRAKGTAGAAWKAWPCLALGSGLYGDAVLELDGITGQVTNTKCGALLFRAQYPGGKAFAYTFCESKNTGYQHLFSLDLSTGAMVLLKSVSWAGGWHVYNGTNCHYRDPAWLPSPGDGDAHLSCQWGRGRVAIVTHANGAVTITGRICLYGTGPQGDPSRGVPDGPCTQVGSDLVWTGALPSGIATSGYIGAGVAAQVAACVHPPHTALFSVANLTVDGEPDDEPPVCG